MATKQGKEDTKQKEEGENDWFFDIIINFLRSPRWKTPIMSFLDEYCIIFDNEDENKLEYTDIHRKFKQLVEELIGELLAELGVSQEIFLQACDKAEKNPIHKKIVDQIVAVDNFVAFKKLMCKRNAELNQQAMKMLEKQAQKQEQEEEKKEQKKKNTDKLLEDQETTAKGEIKDKALQDALKVAQEAEKAEEEEFMRKAIEESQKLEEEAKVKYGKEDEEEAEMIRQAIEMSNMEEDERVRIAKEEKQLMTDQISPKEQPQQNVIVADIQPQQDPIPAPQEESKMPELAPITVVASMPKMATPTPAPQVMPEIKEKDLVEVNSGPVMSEAEKKKLEQMQKLMKEKKLKKQEKPSNDLGLPKLNRDALPPVMMNRRGQFEMIPDFLQQKKVKQDINNLNEMDMMQEAFNKQDGLNNAESGLSMKELFEKKRIESEKKLEEVKKNGPTGPSNQEKQDRVARLKAQRDLLRKQKEDKRQEELDSFKQKTETKEDLFSELKKMDNELKEKGKQYMGSGPQNLNNEEEAEKQRKLAMFRKVRADIKQDDKDEKEMNYQKRVDQIEKKDKSKEPDNFGQGDDFLKGLQTFGAD